MKAFTLRHSLSLLNALEMPFTIRRQKDNTYDFNCYVPGDNSAFSISAPIAAKVSYLTREIFETGVLSMNDVSVADMIMWRVC
jgi:hypothetical protein